MTVIGLLGMLLNSLDLYNLPDRCPPQEFNCGILLDKWHQDREERFLLTLAGVLVYLAGWFASRIHKRRADSKE